MSYVIGPKQYLTLGGFLTEHFIEGDFFSRLGGKMLSDVNVYLIGRRTGDILKKLHSRGVYYNDIIISDDFARSHLIVPEDPFDSILFDYGVALLLDGHPNLSDEEIFNYARTLPFVNMSLDGLILQYGRVPKEVFDSIVTEYMPIIAGSSKEQIMERDLDFISEGLQLAGIRLGAKIIEPFSRGFKETYLH